MPLSGKEVCLRYRLPQVAVIGRKGQPSCDQQRPHPGGSWMQAPAGATRQSIDSGRCCRTKPAHARDSGRGKYRPCSLGQTCGASTGVVLRG
eukprot:2727653-Rhodomonas_salina.1